MKTFRVGFIAYEKHGGRGIVYHAVDVEALTSEEAVCKAVLFGHCSPGEVQFARDLEPERRLREASWTR
jgi:hypothetical protein